MKKTLLAVIAILRLLPVAAGEADSLQRHFAVTDFSVNFLREGPDFPEELGNQLLMGTPVEIVGREGYWRQVVSPDPYTAWCVEMGLVEMSREEMASYIAAPKYIVTAEYSHVFRGPSEKAERVSDLVAGDLLRSVEGKKVKKGFVEVMMPSGTVGYVRKRDMEDFGKWAATRKATPESIVQTAMQFLGVPYQWGGTSVKGVDCSGFTRMVWFMNGVLLPRNASQQARAGEQIPYQGRGADTVDRDTILEFTGSLTGPGMEKALEELAQATSYLRILGNFKNSL